MVENNFDSSKLNSFKSIKLDELGFFRQFPEMRLYDIPLSNEKCYIFDKGWGFEFDVSTSNSFDKNDLENVFNFAFNSKELHKSYRTGGTNNRSHIQIFMNIFLGKLGEIATLKSFQKNNIEMESNEIDYTIRRKGDWDDYDLKTKNGKIISVKSSKAYSQMMLLETKNWNDKTELIYNINTNKAYIYDYHTYSRIAPLKKYGKDKYIYPNAYKFDNVNILNNDQLKNMLHNQIFSYEWVYEDSFIINNEYFKKIIKLNHKLEAKNYVLFNSNVLMNLAKKNGKEKIDEFIINSFNKNKFMLDASNYYFPIKYMFKINDYIDKY